jgi:hypothetical protein
MQTTTKRHIKSGIEFDALFPRPLGGVVVMKRDADVFDTMRHIPKLVRKTTMDTLKIAKRLKGLDLRETCRNIWHFVYEHINYAPDRKGYEELRRPSRAWADRKRGVDCDCYSIFISSILHNLGIRHIFRVTKYEGRNYYQHIYPIVPTTHGKHITIDCVVDAFDYEEPYTAKLDRPMDLHYLNGLGGEEDGLDEDVTDVDFELLDEDGDLSIDAVDLLNGSDLGRRKRKRSRFGNKIRKIAKKVKKGVGKAIHVINRLNPAAGLLRLGFLASMKLNLMKVAEKLRYAYLTETEAVQLGLDMGNWRKLSKARAKADKIFHGAGGKTDNLRKAILKGKGNRNKEVAVFGLHDLRNNVFDERADIRDILGDELVESEVGDNELNGHGLGVVATGAAIAAASSAVAAIAAILKQIGKLRKKGENEDPEIGEDGEALPDVPEDAGFNLDQFTDFLPKTTRSSGDADSPPTRRSVPDTSADAPMNSEQEQTLVVPTPDTEDKPEDKPPRTGFLGFWDKGVGKLTIIGGGALVTTGLIWGGIRLSKQAKAKAEAATKLAAKKPVSGTPKKKPQSSTKSKAPKKSEPNKQRRFQLR